MELVQQALKKGFNDRTNEEITLEGQPLTQTDQAPKRTRSYYSCTEPSGTSRKMSKLNTLCAGMNVARRRTLYDPYTRHRNTLSTAVGEGKEADSVKEICKSMTLSRMNSGFHS